MNSIQTTLFVSLMGLAIVWLGLVVWTFRRLRTRHAETYQAIGSPSLFWNNSMRNNWLFAKFLFGAKWRQLGDQPLSAVARLMQVIFVSYVALFAVAFAYFFAEMPE